MCGIYGWIGKDPKKFNKDKFDKLGIFNISRGKDSCGVSFDGDIIVGASHSDKLYSDFMIKNYDIEVKKYPTVIGHTRQASVGNIVNIANAHPFGFGINKSKDGYEFIGCHNGTLYNTNELATMFNIDKTEEKEETNQFGVKTKTYRTKIDSEILLESIYKNKNFKILNEYVGAAAIVFTNTNEPNKLYVFKGASKTYGYAHEKIEEERPLFYYIENKNSLYFSSIKDSLISICGKNIDNIHSFENNTLYIITDGDINKAEKILISRENTSQKEKLTTNYSKHWNNDIYGRSQDYYDRMNGDIYDQYPAVTKEVNNFITNSGCKVGKIYTKSNIHHEKLLINQNDYGKRVYFNKLRYWKKGHLITGIYTFIPSYGFYELTDNDSLIQALNKMKELVNIPFIDNKFDYDLKGFISFNDTKLFVPFKSTQLDNLHFFVEGVKVKTKVDFNTAYNLFKTLNKNNYLSHVRLSHISTHPVIDLEHPLETEYQNILYEGSLFTGNICPLGSERIYNIDKGCLTTSFVNDYTKSTIWGKTEDIKYKTSKSTSLKENNTNTNTIILPEKLSKDIKEDVQEKEYVSTVIKEYIDDKDMDVIEDETTGELLVELVNEDVSEFLTLLTKHLNSLENKDNKSVKEIELVQDLKQVKDQISIIFENV